MFENSKCESICFYNAIIVSQVQKSLTFSPRVFLRRMLNVASEVWSQKKAGGVSGWWRTVGVVGGMQSFFIASFGIHAK